jgi:hypothetical protein
MDGADQKKVGKLVTAEPGFAGVAYLATCLGRVQFV